MRAKILVTGVLVLALASVFAGQLAAGSDKSHFKTTLSPYGEVPTNSTTGRGELDLRIDDAAQTITFTLTYTGLAAPASAAHIHLGARSTTGGVSVFFCGGAKPACPSGTSDKATVTDTIVATDVVGPTAQGIPAGPTGFSELVAAIRAGVTYANIHNATFPGGEIRGQINDNDQRN